MEIGRSGSGLSDYWVSDAILYYDIQGKSAGQKADYPITGYPRNFILLNKEYFNKK